MLKILSFWIYPIFHLTKLTLYKIALSQDKFSKLFDYNKKTLSGYYQYEGKLFIPFQILLFWLSFIYGFIDQDFLSFKIFASFVSIIAILRTIEFLEPNWIS